MGEPTLQGPPTKQTRGVDQKMEKTIQIQGVGHVRAKPAQDFKPGEHFVWNYGYHSKIVGIAKETQHQIVFITESEDGKRYERRLKKDRLVGIGSALSSKLNKGEITFKQWLGLRKEQMQPGVAQRQKNHAAQTADVSLRRNT
jgi:hypothetical protein